MYGRHCRKIRGTRVAVSSPHDTTDEGRTMMIRRCAWHPGYYGYPLWSGVASWRGISVRFTDGICARCVERFRAEHRHLLDRRRTAPVSADKLPTPAAG
jgi:hypothetical protein